LRILYQVGSCNIAWGIPYLLAFRKHKRAALLESEGLLAIRYDGITPPPTPGGGGCTITKAGVREYNQAGKKRKGSSQTGTCPHCLLSRVSPVSAFYIPAHRANPEP